MMRSFFHRPDAQWRSLTGALHFYLLPGPEDDVHAAYRDAATALTGFEGLAIQPTGFVHVTVQRLDLYLSEVGERWEPAMDRLAGTLAALRSFRLDFAPAIVADDAIEARAEAIPAWHRLIDTVRDAVSMAGAKAALPASPRLPHYSLAYCHRDRPAEPVQRVLDDVARPTSMTVREVALVGVDQDRDSGVFTFTTVRNWRIDE